MCLTSSRTDEWGWSNSLQKRSERMSLVGGLETCKTRSGEGGGGGTVMGSVLVKKASSYVQVTIDVEDEWELADASIWVGNEKLPKTRSGHYTLDPERFRFETSTRGPHSFRGATNCVYVAMHVNLCRAATNPPGPSGPAPVPSPPTPEGNNGGEVQPTEGTRCTAAWVKGNGVACLVNRHTEDFVWTNRLASGTERMEVWSGVGGCSTAGATRVGDVVVRVRSPYVKVTIELEADWDLEDAALWIGGAKLPQTRTHQYILDTELFPHQTDRAGPHQFRINGRCAYLAMSIRVCRRSTTEAPVTALPSTASPPAPVTIPPTPVPSAVEPEEGEGGAEDTCKPSWVQGKSGVCLENKYSDEFGWTNKVAGSESMEIWSGAQGCSTEEADTEGATMVGEVAVVVTRYSVEVTISLHQGWELADAALWLGRDKLPRKRSRTYSLDPDTFPFQLTEAGPHKYRGDTSCLYLALYVEVCRAGGALTTEVPSALATPAPVTNVPDGVEPEPTDRCSSAWAKGDEGKCMTNSHTGAFGWSTSRPRGGDMELWAGATGCSMEGATHVGNVEVEVVSGAVVVTLHMLEGWTLVDAAIWVGKEKLPRTRTGHYTLDPENFPLQTTEAGPHSFSGPTQCVYIAIQAEVCNGEATTAPPSPSMTPVPSTQEPEPTVPPVVVQPGQCAPSWVRGAGVKCLKSTHNDDFGWTNRISGSETMEIWSGAEGCSTEGATLAGEVAVVVTSYSVELTISLHEGWEMTEAAIWLGSDKLPKTRTRQYTLDPERFPFQTTKRGPLTFRGSTRCVYLAMLVTVCQSGSATEAPALTPAPGGAATPPPTPAPTVVVEPEGCVSAWVKGEHAVCLLNRETEDFSWTNKVSGSETMEIWSGVQGCTTEGATHIGTVRLTITSSSASVLIDISEPGWTLADSAIWLGSGKLPKSRTRQYILDPERFPFQVEGNGPHTYKGSTSCIYFAMNVRVCKQNDTQAPVAVTASPPTAAPSTVAPPTSAPATSAPATNPPATSAPATSAPDTSAPATSAPDTSAPPTVPPIIEPGETTATPTVSPPTSAPATDAPATDAPATNAPATDAPATNAPATDAPATNAPATDAPATDAPATNAPATDAPATNAPVTDAPATDAPATNAPATDAPATDAPATNAPATDAPATDAPATNAPATDAPATNAPATDAPATDAPATDAPATDAPATNAPATDAPATDAPATDAPATDAPATDAPATDAPATNAPATDAPATDAPATDAPATNAPTSEPEPCIDITVPPSVRVAAGEAGVTVPVGVGVPVTDGMPGWTADADGPVSLTGFPPVLTLPGTTAFFPPQAEPLPAMSVLSVSCPSNCESTPCEVIVSSYYCPPCSFDTDGGLFLSLVGSGWDVGSCAPKFDGMNMVSFRKLVPAGTTEQMPPLMKPLANFAVFLRQHATDCAAVLDMGVCSSSPECRWEAGEGCLSAWCPQEQGGAGGEAPELVCDECATTAPTTAPTSAPATAPPLQCATDVPLDVKVGVGGFSDVPFDSGAGVPVAENMQAFTVAGDGAPATLTGIPTTLTLPTVQAFFPVQPLPDSTWLEFECPQNCANAPCEVIVSAYHCPPCSTSTNGGLPEIMPQAGWSAGNCAPSFTSGGTHTMVSYRKLVPAGTTGKTPGFTAPLANVAVFVRSFAVDCTALLSEDACTPSECLWEAGLGCSSAWCPAPPPGLPPIGGGPDGGGACTECAGAPFGPI